MIHKKVGARDRAFSLYIYIENFKNLLVRNHWIDLDIILQNCFFGDPVPLLFKPLGFLKKKMATSGTRFNFPIRLYRNFEEWIKK